MNEEQRPTAATPGVEVKEIFNVSVVQGRLVSLARHATRRSFLARMGKLVLATTGVGTTYLALGQVTPRLAEATHECGFDQWCGLCGTPCSACGGQFNQCPTNNFIGAGAWTRCCTFGDGNAWLISYYDCCGTSCSGHGGRCQNAPGCTATPWDPWCEGTYNCTVALYIGWYPC